MYCINFTGNKDEDIDKIIKYAFNRILGWNTNLLTMACIGKSKEDAMEEINQFLSENTKYKGDEQNEKTNNIII